jgi:exopolysaccharide production protein ExoZ
MSSRNAAPSLIQALNGTPGKERIVPMEGMRGLAVLIVFLVHHHTIIGESLLTKGGTVYQISMLAHAIGHSGVDLFFVLSGFLIYGHLMQRQMPYRTYIRKRLRRIYPTFAAVFSLYCLVSLVAPSLSKIPAGKGPGAMYLLENFLLLPGMLKIDPLITVAWSLSYELFFYLSIPLLIMFTGMCAWPRWRRVLFFLLLALASAGAAQAGLNRWPRLGMFLAGILLYETIASGQLSSRLTRATEAGAIGFYFLVSMTLALYRLGSGPVGFEPAFPNYLYVPWTVLLSCSIFFLALHGFVFGGWISRFFSIAPLRWLGNMSYSYFLLHGMVLNGVRFGLHRLGWLGMMSPALFTGVLLCNLLLTLACSLALFALVERRFSLAPVRKKVDSRASEDTRLAIPPFTLQAEMSSHPGPVHAHPRVLYRGQLDA